MKEQRATFNNLVDVCMDCMDFIENTYINCEKCPVFILKNEIHLKED